MTDQNPSRAAFPVNTEAWLTSYSGLTKRELIATALFQGVMANPRTETSVQDGAKFAIRAADTLLEELSK